MRKRLGQKHQADDWLMLPAFAGIIGLSTMYFYGLGTKSPGYRYMHFSSSDFVPGFAGPTSRIVRTRRWECSSLILFSATAGLIKISVLLLYRRIFTIIPSYKDARNLLFIVMFNLVWLPSRPAGSATGGGTRASICATGTWYVRGARAGAG
ncbi:hypothetical protein PMIN03_011799 [Paraphaeosphaeria minitans]